MGKSVSKKILISGSHGFIGQALVSKFEKEYELILPSAKAMDIRDEKAVERVLQQTKPNFIIHLAARTEVEKSFYEQKTFAEINYVGTTVLADVAHRVLGDNLELFVFSSTMETYGWQPKENWKPFNEETPQNPNAPYAVAKVGGELYLQYLGRTVNFPYTILRQTNAYGRVDNDFFVVEQIITQMLKGDTCKLGYREPYRNFLYIDDLVELYYKIIKNVHLAKGEIFCTGPDNVIQISQLAELIAKKLDWKGTITWGTKPERPGEIYYLNSTAEKAKKVLNWEPQVGLDEGLERTIKKWSST